METIYHVNLLEFGAWIVVLGLCIVSASIFGTIALLNAIERAWRQRWRQRWRRAFATMPSGGEVEIRVRRLDRSGPHRRPAWVAKPRQQRLFDFAVSIELADGTPVKHEGQVRP